MAKNVQISQELFLDLVRYFLLDDTSKSRLNAIQQGLEAKVDNMVKHELYTASKTADSPEDREKARQQYLELKGIHKDFRW